MIGRERELAEANGFLAEAAERSCGLLLAGEPGIGKTTIWSAVTEEAVRRGFRVLVARPTEAESELAFAVLSDLFALVDEAVLAALPEAQRQALEQALRRRESQGPVDPTAIALATLGTLRTLSTAAPSIVAVDDLQWADGPSLRALTFALRRLADAQVGLVATVRTGFDHDLTRLAAHEASPVDRIEIGGLGKRHLGQLVHERTGISLTPPQLTRLAALSNGSPYYALELAATHDPELEVPESLSVVLRVRLTGLSPAARAAGLTAACLGRVDEAVMSGAHVDGLDELRAAGIVEETAAGPGFAHPLLASTLRDMHSPEERRATHRALAESVSDPDERAIHLARGAEGEDEAVAAELEAAASRLDRRGAPEVAAALAQRAAELTPPGKATQQARRLIRAADLYQAAGEGRTRVLPLLEPLADMLPAGTDRARVLVRLGWLGAELDTLTTTESVAYLERALAEADGSREVEAAANAALARVRGLGGDFRAWLRHAELALAAGAEHEANGMFPSPYAELGMARFLAGEGLDEDLFTKGAERESRLARVGEPYQSSRLKHGWALLCAGELSRARALLLEQLELSASLERVRSIAGCYIQLVDLEVRAGNLAAAERYAADFVDLDRQLRGESSEEWYPSGIVAAHLGRVDDARRILRAGIEYSRSIESESWLAHHMRALGFLELSAGDLVAARDLLLPLASLLREAGFGEWSVQPFHPDAIEALVGLGELEEAVDLTGELDEYGRRLDRPWGLATAARSRALIASARGDLDEALAGTGRALAVHERLDWPFERGRTLLVQGGILRRLGRRRDAAAVLAEARAAFAAVRNPLWVAKTDAEAGRLGGRRASGDALTPTEERVAELAGEGLRNAEIAAQLYVTEKTVEATLSRVYRKLGVRSRTELAGRAAARRAAG